MGRMLGTSPGDVLVQGRGLARLTCLTLNFMLISCGGANAAAAKFVATERHLWRDVVGKPHHSGATSQADGLPTESLEIETHTLGKMTLDDLFTFLARVSNDDKVAVSGSSFSGIHDELNTFQSQFGTLEAKYAQVNDIWVAENFNPNTVTPDAFASSLTAVTQFTALGATATLVDASTAKLAVTPGNAIYTAQALTCLTSVPPSLDACINARDQAGCNDLTAAWLCGIYDLNKVTAL